MARENPTKPSTLELPKYLREPLEKQSVERLEDVAVYAADLADWKRQQHQEELEHRRAEEEIDEEELEDLNEREIRPIQRITKMFQLVERILRSRPQRRLKRHRIDTTTGNGGKVNPGRTNTSHPSTHESRNVPSVFGTINRDLSEPPPPVIDV